MTDARTTTGFAALSMDELLERRANAMLAMSELETKLRQLMREGYGDPKAEYLDCVSNLVLELALLYRLDKELAFRNRPTLRKKYA
ncbi:MAG: hypothetical protein WAW62_04625 [Candidatus Saccharimonas aalborgensis]